MPPNTKNASTEPAIYNQGVNTHDLNPTRKASEPTIYIRTHNQGVNTHDFNPPRKPFDYKNGAAALLALLGIKHAVVRASKEFNNRGLCFFSAVVWDIILLGYGIWAHIHGAKSFGFSMVLLAVAGVFASIFMLFGAGCQQPVDVYGFLWYVIF